jgi:hypothetical protein
MAKFWLKTGVTLQTWKSVFFDGDGLYYRVTTGVYEAFNQARWDAGNYWRPMTDDYGIGFYRSQVPTGAVECEAYAGATPLATAQPDYSAEVRPDSDNLNAGDGDTEVDHNTGGADNLRYVTPANAGIDNARVIAYLRSEYDAGTYRRRGRTYTKSDGRWVAPLMLNAGMEYAIWFEESGVFGPDVKYVTVPA